MSDGIPGGPPRFGPPPAPAKPAPARGPEKKGQKPPPGAKAKAPEGQASSTVTADGFSRAVAGSATVQVKPSTHVRANVHFAPGQPPKAQGELRQGGKLVITFEPARAPLQVMEHGAPVWGVAAHLRFEPRGETVERPAVEFQFRMGRFVGEARISPVAVDVPVHATSVEVRFCNWVKGARPAEHWDDADGARFRFPVKPPLPVQP